MLDRVVFLVLVLLTLLAGQAIYWLVRYTGERRHADLRRRLRQVGVEPGQGGLLLRPGRYAKSERLNRLMDDLGWLAPLRTLLIQTEYEWTVAQLLGYSGIFALLGFVVALLLRSRMLASFLPLVCLFVPALLVFNSRIKRSLAISRQLPEALDLLSRSLRAGHALPTSIKVAAHELPMPIATEFARCYEEQTLGEKFEQSILHMADRVPGNLDLRIFAVSVVIQKQVGGNIAEIMDQISQTIRERYKFYGQLRALTAEGKASGMILGALPWLVLGVIWVIRKSFLMELFSDSIGRSICAGALGLWLFGIFWMSRIVKVEV